MKQKWTSPANLKLLPSQAMIDGLNPVQQVPEALLYKII